MHVLQNRRKTETGFFYRATHIQLICIAQHMAWCHRVICPAGRHTQILPRNGWMDQAGFWCRGYHRLML